MSFMVRAVAQVPASAPHRGGGWSLKDHDLAATSKQPLSSKEIMKCRISRGARRWRGSAVISSRTHSEFSISTRVFWTPLTPNGAMCFGPPAVRTHAFERDFRDRRIVVG